MVYKEDEILDLQKKENNLSKVNERLKLLIREQSLRE